MKVELKTVQIVAENVKKKDKLAETGDQIIETLQKTTMT